MAIAGGLRGRRVFAPNAGASTSQPPTETEVRRLWPGGFARMRQDRLLAAGHVGHEIPAEDLDPGLSANSQAFRGWHSVACLGLRHGMDSKPPHNLADLSCVPECCFTSSSAVKGDALQGKRQACSLEVKAYVGGPLDVRTYRYIKPYFLRTP